MARILIAEDDPLLRKLYDRVLGVEHELTITSDGAEALDAIETAAGAFDVVITDAGMPKISGIELCAKLAEAYPPLAERIVLVSGRAELPPELALLGITRVEKPVDPGTMRRVVRGILDRARGRGG